MLRRRALPLACAFLIAAGTPVTAGEPDAADRADSPWQGEAFIYAWIPEMQGSAVVRGASIPIDVTFDDVFDLLGKLDLFGAGGYFAMRYRRLGFFVDAFGAVVDTSEDIGAKTVTIDCCPSRVPPIVLHTPPGEVDVRVDSVLLTFGASYRLCNWAIDAAGRRRLWIEPTVGARYSFLGVDIDAHAGQAALAAEDSIDIIDPVFGGRWGLDLLERLQLSFWGDIGGFGVDSHLTWSLTGLLSYRLPWKPYGSEMRTLSGYRVIAYDRDGDTLDEIDLQLRGPLLGLGVRF